MIYHLLHLNDRLLHYGIKMKITMLSFKQDKERGELMINFLSKRIAVFFVQNGVIEQKDSDIYEYGFNLILSAIISILLVIIIGSIFELLPHTLLYLLFFIPIRSYAGGYHARTYFQCIFLFVAVFAVAVVITIFTPYEYSNILILFFIIISMCLTYIFAPVKHENNPISEEEQGKYRSISLLLSVAYAMVLVIGLWVFPSFKKFFLMASMGSFAATITLPIGIILSRRKVCK